MSDKDRPSDDELQNAMIDSIQETMAGFGIEKIVFSDDDGNVTDIEDMRPKGDPEQAFNKLLGDIADYFNPENDADEDEGDDPFQFSDYVDKD